MGQLRAGTLRVSAEGIPGNSWEVWWTHGTTYTWDPEGVCWGHPRNFLGCLVDTWDNLDVGP